MNYSQTTLLKVRHEGQKKLLFYHTFTEPPGPSFSLLQDCRSVIVSPNIIVECGYSGSIASGFQVIAQLSNSSETGKIFASHSTNRQTMASIQVEEIGVYFVTVFAIGDTGIVDSEVEYRAEVKVDDIAATTSAATAAGTTVALGSPQGKCCFQACTVCSP